MCVARLAARLTREPRLRPRQERRARSKLESAAADDTRSVTSLQSRADEEEANRRILIAHLEETNGNLQRIQVCVCVCVADGL